MSEEAKARYQALFQKARAIINRHDPAGLAPGTSGGAPVDEYDSEVAPIVAFVVHKQEEIKLNRQILIDEINRVWQEYFNEVCELAEEIASDIVHECM